ncbi:MAG: extracellular solute-binding protein [Candidatus Omnitrophota bacterium]
MKVRNIHFFAGIGMCAALFIALQGCGGSDKSEETTTPKKSSSSITVYTSVDRDYAEPIIEGFKQVHPEITVNAKYDAELTKTTGLYTLILNEKSNPQADVFWNSEIVRTIQLKQQGVLQPYQSPSAQEIPDRFKDKEGYWTGFSARARVMIINNNLVPETETPSAVPSLIDAKYIGKTAMAIPMFGTTCDHMAALYTIMGEGRFGVLMMKMKGNQVKLLQGNAMVRDEAAAGTIAYGLTDTDDVIPLLEQSQPVRMAFLDQDGAGTLLIPNTVSLIKDAPNTEGGKIFIDYLLSPEVEARLAESRARQIPLRASVPRQPVVPDLAKIKVMDVDYEVLAKNVEPCLEFLRKVFN